MKAELKIKITVDIAMTIALILLMGYIITGDLAHEIIGTVMIILWIVHNILNRRWYSALMKGKYPLKRIINTVINLLLLLSVIGLIISSIILSTYVFSFLGIESGMGMARLLHMVSAYWCFVLSSLHLGLHWSRMINIMKSNMNVKPSKTRSVILHTVFISASCFGAYAFIKQQILLYMFLRTIFVFFDFEQSLFSFFFEYICMMILFASAAYYSSFLMNRKTGVNYAE